MKKRIGTYTIIFLFSVSLLSFKKNHRKKFIPPGTVQLTEHFFVDETEVSNISWAEYVFWMRDKYGRQSQEYLAALQDTNVWLDKKAYSAPYARYYHHHKAYRNFPVVGVTREQAIEFCNWRTDRVKQFYSIKYKKELKIRYRLPTEKEWEDFTPPMSSVRDARGQIRLNCWRDEELDSTAAGAVDIITPIYAYWKNRHGLYQCLGNVAEMVEESGIAKGGSWRHDFEKCRPGVDLNFNKAESWVGLRCVCDYTP